MYPHSKSLETWKNIGPLKVYQIFENSEINMKLNDEIDKIEERIIG
jgi:hypothetical protein